VNKKIVRSMYPNAWCQKLDLCDRPIYAIYYVPDNFQQSMRIRLSETTGTISEAWQSAAKLVNNIALRLFESC
jgi:hypothetical protein